MNSTPPQVAISTRPLPPCSRRFRTSSSACMFQAQSYSPGLQHRAGSRHDVAAALHLHGVEERPVRDVIARVELRPDRVAGLEIHVPVRPGAHRLEIGGRLAGLGAPERLEDVLREDHAAVAAEGVGPERGRLGEAEAHRMAVERLRALDRAVAPRGHRGRRGVGGVLPVEDDVFGGERLPVVPLDALLEPPRHRPTIPRHAAVLDARQLLGQDRHEASVGVEGGERLVEEAGAVGVREPGGEVRVEQGGALPPERPEVPAASAARGREGGRAGVCARPTEASIWLTSGAVRPAPIIMRVNCRRETIPSRTR